MVKTRRRRKMFSSRISREKLPTFLLTINKLKKEGHDEKLPHALLEELTPSSHPLHDILDWDNKVAGDKWRLHQCRMYIGSVSFQMSTVKTVGGRTDFRYFNTVKTIGVSARRYYSADEMLGNISIRNQIKDQVLSEAKFFIAKYARHVHLFGKPLQDVIDTLKRFVANL